MGLCNNFQQRQGILRALVIHLVCWFSWFSCFAFAQFDISEGVTGSVNFPALGITCVANLAVFATSLIRGGLNLEIGARDVIDSVTRPKLKNITGIEHGRGLTTCRGKHLDSSSVVFLSNGAPNWSMEQFMRSNAPFVDCILLQFLSLQNATITVETCEGGEHRCNCIVFWTMEEITMMLARRMPGTLKHLSSSLYLLPCLTCLTNGCHGCSQEDLLRVEGPLPLEQFDDGYGLRESGSKVVSEILNKIRAGSIRPGYPICICIPMNDARHDQWTKLLIRSLRSKDAEGRGVRVMASEALEGYLAGRKGGEYGTVKYNFFSFVAPRLTEVLINLVLTFWFRVDGFSSGLVARRTVRDYLVDSKGSGLAANSFLEHVKVKSDQNNNQVVQVLYFRSYFQLFDPPLFTLSERIICYFTGCVNLVAALGWVLLISFEGEGEGGANTSPTPSMAILVVIVAAIATTVFMETGGVVAGESLRLTVPGFVPILLIKKRRTKDSKIGLILYFTGLALELVCILAGSVVAATLGIKVFGRWVYVALQTLVWLKWITGCYFLNDQNLIKCFGRDPEGYRIWIYSSAFLLNAVLAGVRCKWEPWPWKDNPLFSRKLIAP